MKYDFTLDTDSNSVLIKHKKDGKNYIKEVGTKDLISIISSTTTKEDSFNPIISPLLSKSDDIELLQWIKLSEKKEVHIFLKKAKKEYFQLFEQSFGLCGYPTLIFAIITVNNTFQKFKLTVTQETDINMNTKIYRYPFSNVSNNSFFVCTGMNKIAYKIENINDFKKVIESFFYMPNTFEAFTPMNNSEHLEFRELASSLQDKEFPNEILIENGTYENFINSFIK